MVVSKNNRSKTKLNCYWKLKITMWLLRLRRLNTTHRRIAYDLAGWRSSMKAPREGAWRLRDQCWLTLKLSLWRLTLGLVYQSDTSAPAVWFHARWFSGAPRPLPSSLKLPPDVCLTEKLSFRVPRSKADALDLQYLIMLLFAVVCWSMTSYYYLKKVSLFRKTGIMYQV